MPLPLPHPHPSTDFFAFKLPLKIYRRPWFRVHRLEYDPLYFGCSGNRFDAPSSEFGVLYASEDAHGAFIETFGHKTGTRFVVQSQLEERGLASIVPKRPLRLVDFAGSGLARLGADARLTSGESYEAPQRWMLAIHEHHETPDGIVYRARHDPSKLCAAIFDRVAADLEVKPLGALADGAHAKLLARLLDTYDFGLI